MDPWESKQCSSADQSTCPSQKQKTSAWSQLHFPWLWTENSCQCNWYILGKLNRVYQSSNFRHPSLALSVNEKHFSNTTESIKLINKSILAHVEDTRQYLCLPDDQKALLIFDAFRGQTAIEVLECLEENHLHVSKVPVNLTHLLALDLTVNKSIKYFTKRKFTSWYQDQLHAALEMSNTLKKTNSTPVISSQAVTSLHAQLLVDCFNHVTSDLKSGNHAQCMEEVEKCSDNLPNLDPFHDIDPLWIRLHFKKQPVSTSIQLNFNRTKECKIQISMVVTEMNGNTHRTWRS